MSARRTTRPLPGEENGEGDYLPTKYVDANWLGIVAELILRSVARLPENDRQKTGIAQLERVALEIQATIRNRDRSISRDLPRLRTLFADAMTLARRDGFVDSDLFDGWGGDE